ncbi:hypothetical protein F4810DRAFT_304622 [Camillea tinctor]|nr:hypothetical protein F4810DRAFT_304622 [Camillea tinctor]
MYCGVAVFAAVRALFTASYLYVGVYFSHDVIRLIFLSLFLQALGNFVLTRRIVEVTPFPKTKEVQCRGDSGVVGDLANL